MVFAFEPSPPTFQRLRANFDDLAESPCGLEAIPAAVGAVDGGSVDMYVSSQHGWSTLSQEAVSVGVALGRGITEVVAVPLVSLDGFFYGPAPHRVPQALKIDVEGWEEDVVRGAERLLRSGAVRIVVVERNDAILSSMNRRWSDVDRLICDFGYAVDRIVGDDVVYRRSGGM
jgi:FkbM family methyltransferase